MTQHTETILTKQIKGLTWGIVISMLTTASGGIYFAFKGYNNLLIAIATGKTNNDNMNKRMDANDRRDDKQDDKIDYITENYKQK